MDGDKNGKPAFISAVARRLGCHHRIVPPLLGWSVQTSNRLAAGIERGDALHQQPERSHGGLFREYLFALQTGDDDRGGKAGKQRHDRTIADTAQVAAMTRLYSVTCR
jgi:hypothetical protein